MLLTRADVLEILSDLLAELESSHETFRIQVVGGAAVALQLEREALTVDIDTLRCSQPALISAAGRVADAKGLPSDWLNDAANMWASHFDREEDWEVLLSGSSSSILVARAPLLLAMKLLAGRGRRDAEDIDLLLDACGVRSANDAIELFNRYYPTESVAPKALAHLEARFGVDP